MRGREGGTDGWSSGRKGGTDGMRSREGGTDIVRSREGGTDGWSSGREGGTDGVGVGKEVQMELAVGRGYGWSEG